MSEELAYRASNGIEVVLFWNRPENTLAVAVSDERTGAYFELPVDSGEALDAFHHPYAYAAHQGVPYDTALLASWPQPAAA